MTANGTIPDLSPACQIVKYNTYNHVNFSNSGKPRGGPT